MQCSCGATIKVRAMTLHKRGASHLQRRRIKALLAKVCIPHREIARRCRVSFERVRQIAKSIGAAPGFDRIRTCSLNRASKAARDLVKADRRLKALARSCHRSGLELEFIPSAHRTVAWPILRAKVLIEGRVCALRSAIRAHENVVIKRPLLDGDVAFVCYLMPDGRWLVIPRERLPRGNTSFRPELRQLRRGTNRHDWQNYIDAWDLLRRAREAVAA